MKVERRMFFKIGLGLVAGGVSTALMLPAKTKITEVLESTDVKAGNAGLVKEVTDLCQDSNDSKECAKNYFLSPWRLLEAGFIVPASEEFSYRWVVSELIGENSGVETHAKEDLLLDRGINLSRKEWIAGSISSLIFAATHNVNADWSINTERFPITQFIGGMQYWYLQRRFGFSANLSAHILNNVIPRIWLFFI